MKESPSGLGLPLPIQIFCGLSDDRNFTSSRKISKEEDSRESLMLPASYELNSNWWAGETCFESKNEENMAYFQDVE